MASEAAEIRFWNRARGREDVEHVYGDAFVRALYGTRAGQGLTEGVLAGHALSRAYGLYQSSSLSRHKVPRFIRDFKIDMGEYEPGPFRSFNQFFVRRFRPGARIFAAEPGILPAFAEARYLAWERVTAEQEFPVKGEFLTAAALLGGDARASSFEGGPAVIARLCPVDYHRYHFPDDGETEAEFQIAGRLHSVNPLALRFRGDILVTNERRVSILRTRNFGKLAYIEVGALCVGRIVPTHPRGVPFRRGEEKGYFLFGGSTVVLLGEPGAWRPDSDLLEQTSARRETLVRLGESLARALKPQG